MYACIYMYATPYIHCTYCTYLHIIFIKIAYAGMYVCLYIGTLEKYTMDIECCRGYVPTRDTHSGTKYGLLSLKEWTALQILFKFGQKTYLGALLCLPCVLNTCICVRAHHIDGIDAVFVSPTHRQVRFQSKHVIIPLTITEDELKAESIECVDLSDSSDDEDADTTDCSLPRKMVPEQESRENFVLRQKAEEIVCTIISKAVKTCL